ncbi:hypothetical protein IID22_04175, partial [Patescibacteria group bacterium]|nr:hypothetical protein [Patescibacteria group bacterium]
WFLGFVHGAGRAVPLVFLAILGILGVNATSKIAKKKDAIEKYTGWALVYIGAFILTFGLFGHDWFIASGIHGFWEQIVANVGGARFGEIVLKHEHKLVNIPEFVKYGNFFMLGVIATTNIWYFIKHKPGKKGVIALVSVFALFVLLIGASTGWTFMTGTNVHLEHSADTEEESEPEDGHDEDERAHEASLVLEEGEVREGLVVNLNFSPVPASTSAITRLDFFVNEKPANEPVTDLEIEHTKFMHTIGVRDDLEEFFHIHPVAATESAGLWSVEHLFEKPGSYKLWTDVGRGGMTYTFGHPEISIKGEGPTQTEGEMSFDKNRVVGNDELGIYQVALNYDEPIAAGQEADLVFSVSGTTGGLAELEPFLGEDVHVAIIKDDLKTFIHSHPTSSSQARLRGASPEGRVFVPVVYANGDDEHDDGDGTAEGHEGVSFHVTFTEPGIYRAFAQFRPSGIELDADEALTAGFWLSVEEGKEETGTTISKSAQWWGLLIASLILMTLLSLGVHKYLQVKAPAKKDVEPKVETPTTKTEESSEQKPEKPA